MNIESLTPSIQLCPRRGCVVVWEPLMALPRLSIFQALGHLSKGRCLTKCELIVSNDKLIIVVSRPADSLEIHREVQFQ